MSRDSTSTIKYIIQMRTAGGEWMDAPFKQDMTFKEAKDKLMQSRIDFDEPGLNIPFRLVFREDSPYNF